MPTWLGGSNKAKTAEYKAKNDIKNDAIESYMKAHNCTRSQAKKALKQLAQLNNNSTSGTKVKPNSEQKDTKSAVQPKKFDPSWLNPDKLPSDKPKNIWDYNEQQSLWYDKPDYT